MSQINKIGLLIWLVVIANLQIKSPFHEWRDFVCFVALVVLGSWCFLTKRGADSLKAGENLPAKSDKSESDSPA